MADVKISQLDTSTPSGDSVIPFSNGINTFKTLASSLTASCIPQGALFNVAQSPNNDHQVINFANGTTEYQVTNMTVTITPKYTASQILVWYDLKGATENVSVVSRLYRSINNQAKQRVYSASLTPYTIGSASYTPNAEGNAMSHSYYAYQIPHTYMYVDNPNTVLPVTYTIWLINPGTSGGQPWVKNVGRWESIYKHATTSNIIAVELAL